MKGTLSVQRQTQRQWQIHVTNMNKQTLSNTEKIEKSSKLLRLGLGKPWNCLLIHSHSQLAVYSSSDMILIIILTATNKLILIIVWWLRPLPLLYQQNPPPNESITVIVRKKKKSSANFVSLRCNRHHFNISSLSFLPCHLFHFFNSMDFCNHCRSLSFFNKTRQCCFSVLLIQSIFPFTWSVAMPLLLSLF